MDRAIDAVLVPVEGAQAGADGLPYATHRGMLTLAPGLHLEVFRLSTGERIVSEAGATAFFEWLGQQGGDVA